MKYYPDKQKQKGFTLIEILVVLGVVVFVSGVVGGVFFVALRSAKKANSETIVRENGEYAMSQMTRMIRYAQSFDGVKTNSGDALTPACPTTSGGSATATDGSVSHNPYHYLQITALDGGQTTYSCVTGVGGPASTAITIASRSADQNLVSMHDVSVTACSITCVQPTQYDPPVITIDYTLESTTGTLGENYVQIPFESSVTLRNIIPQ